MTLAEYIIEDTAKAFDEEPSKIYSEDRTRDVSEARDASIWLIKERLGLSNWEIGNILGSRLPSTVSHSLKRTRERLKMDSRDSEQFRCRLSAAKKLCKK
jgi:chromosomal replication initiation ATPase DnaA